MKYTALFLLGLLLVCSNVYGVVYSITNYNLEVIAENCITFTFEILKNGDPYLGSSFTVTLYKYDGGSWVKQYDLSNRAQSSNTWTYTQGNILQGDYQLYLTYPDLYVELLDQFTIAESGYLLLPLITEIIKPDKDAVAYIDQTIWFVVQITGGLGPYDVQWNFGDGDVGNGEQVSHIYDESGTYIIQCVVTDSLATQVSVYKTLVVHGQGKGWPTSSREYLSINVVDEGGYKISLRVCASTGVKTIVVSIKPEVNTDPQLTQWAGACPQNWGSNSFLVDETVEYTITVSGYDMYNQFVAYSTCKFKYKERSQEKAEADLLAYIEVTKKQYPEMPSDPILAWAWMLEENERLSRELEDALRENASLQEEKGTLTRENKDLNDMNIRLQTELDILKTNRTPAPTIPTSETETNGGMSKGELIVSWLVISFIAIVAIIVVVKRLSGGGKPHKRQPRKRIIKEEKVESKKEEKEKPIEKPKKKKKHFLGRDIKKIEKELLGDDEVEEIPLFEEER